MTTVLRGNAALACAQVVTRRNRFQLFPGCVNATGRDMETSGNGSTCSHVCANYKSSLGDTGDFLVGSVILFVIVSAVMLNTFVICSFAARWKSITITDYYILTLAVSDLCSPLFAYPMAMMSTFSHGWLFGETGRSEVTCLISLNSMAYRCCTINGFLGFFFGIADIFTLSLLSFSRFLCVCCPTSVFCFTRKRVLASIIGVIVMSTFWATCPLFGWGDYDVEPFGTSCTLKWSSTDRWVSGSL
ncbi:opsin-5-like [Pomacea canaliculata]|uniref:opsin-5-like n=1 Tax=Pomacea canaliculata TaxID=400727 RepID=UPI000D73ECB2|nr:opsin-5-like [Pomacea canaliculata]